MANNTQVLELHAKGMPPSRIAENLGCMPEYVRATLRRKGLKSHSERLEMKMAVAYRNALGDIVNSDTIAEAKRIAKAVLRSSTP